MNRRSFLRLGATIAPAIILTPGLLMKVKPLHAGGIVTWKPETLYGEVPCESFMLSWAPPTTDLPLAHYEISILHSGGVRRPVALVGPNCTQYALPTSTDGMISMRAIDVRGGETRVTPWGSGLDVD